MKIDFISEQVPDATMLLKFCHIIEKNHLGEEFFKAINRVMDATGHIMHGDMYTKWSNNAFSPLEQDITKTGIETIIKSAFFKHLRCTFAKH